MKELHQSTLYRTQRLIRMGEWLERNMHTLTLAEATAQQIADLPVAEDVPSMEGTIESFNNLMDLGQRIVDRGKDIADS